MIELAITLKKAAGGWTVCCGDWVSPVMDEASALQTALEMAATVRLTGDRAEVVVEDR